MSQGAALNRFLAEVERSAFHLARAAVRDPDEALDIVQDTMFTLARKYGSKPSDEWRPLFFRILQNRIRDWHRRTAVRRQVVFEAVIDGVDQIDRADGQASSNPMERTRIERATDRLQTAVETLPLRQQQAFLLRSIEGMNVAETASVMRCSEGSVKTHYSRAVHALRDALEGYWS
jgi:RNA polymerase sigma-70 factor (ECF subfamily)